jgi:hypothetical protein
VSSTNHESPLFVFVPIPSYFIPLRPKYLSHPTVLHELFDIINFEYCSVYGVMANVWFDALFALCMTNILCRLLPILMVENSPYRPWLISASTDHMRASCPRLVSLAAFVTG